MANPLTLLRQYNINKKEIIERDNKITFGEISWPKNVLTNYQVQPAKGRSNDSKEYYTLECLLYILKHSQLIHPEYVRQAKAANIQAVLRPDRKKLLAYLNGETDTSASIDTSAPSAKAAKDKRTRDHDINEFATKKRRIGDNHEKDKKHQAIHT